MSITLVGLLGQSYSASYSSKSVYDSSTVPITEVVQWSLQCLGEGPGLGQGLGVFVLQGIVVQCSVRQCNAV